MLTTGNEFGRFFRNRRISLGLNLSEFCRRNGFDKGNISRLERGLMLPPNRLIYVKTYAQALQLQQDSEDWKLFIRLAANAWGKLPPNMADKRVAFVTGMLRRRLHDSWVKARDLENWSLTREAQAEFPTLIRKLIYASTDGPIHVELPSGDGVQRHGWDGIVETPNESLFVSAGVSVWEISTNQRPADKAEHDFKAKRSNPRGRTPSEITFIFVTSRKWDGKQKWRR